MKTVNPAGWSSTASGSPGEARFKWWFDTVGQDAFVFGTSVANAEYLIMLEDRFNNAGGVNSEGGPRDGLGELTFMDDLAHAGFTARWNNPAASPVEYVQNTPGTLPSPSTLWHRVLGSGTAHPPTGGLQSSTSDPDIGYQINGQFVDMYVSLAALGHPAKICLIWATDNHDENLDQAPNCDAPESTSCLLVPVIDINVDKTLDQPIDGTADIGETVVFKVVIINTGNTTLTLIPFQDTYDPTKLQFISANPTPDHQHIHTATLAHLHWDDLTGPAPNGFNTNLAPDGSFTITITFTAIGSTAPGSTLDIADVIEAEDEFGNHISDTDSATVIINSPPPPGNVIIDKTLTTPAGGITSVGGNVVFTVNITNNGGLALATVQLVDTFDPAKLSFVSATPSNPDSQSPAGTLTWNDLTGVGSLAPGNSIIVTITFTALASTGAGATQDTATATADTLPPVSDFAFVTIRQADVDVQKTLTQPASGTAFIGDTVTFTIEVTNTGGTTLIVIPLTDTYDPTVLDFVSANPTPDTVNEDAGTLDWNDLTGPAPNGFNTELAPANSFYVAVTFKAIGPTTPDTNDVATVTNALDDGSPQAQVSDSDISSVVIGFPPVTLPPPIEPKPVGGYVIPTNKLAILEPYLALAGLFGALSAALTVIRRRRA